MPSAASSRWEEIRRIVCHDSFVCFAATLIIEEQIPSYQLWKRYAPVVQIQEEILHPDSARPHRSHPIKDELFDSFKEKKALQEQINYPGKIAIKMIPQKSRNPSSEGIFQGCQNLFEQVKYLRPHEIVSKEDGIIPDGISPETHSIRLSSPK
ncbi:hypothetical protein K469DRAFT_693847 [Zopfia rhizophila CBS 207.26]|uniref:Uncharacterized protein n=1 Tax=Zopfia rhizophila CBS 207.26 TaxID=1314779 RepID=A0A6A6DL77_9PEZI|nr:hypothetical protein K469DRAFT_693847 [Zopfia rhizophila CBS 207.26]